MRRVEARGGEDDDDLGRLLVLARLAGDHALPLFATLLALLLALTALGWWSAHRYTTRAAVRGGGAAIPVLFRLAAGFAVIVVAGAGFAALVDVLGGERTLGRIDDTFTRAMVGSMPHSALVGFAGVTLLGDPGVLTAVGVAVALWLGWLRRPGLLFGWVAALAGNGILNWALKQIFARARPLHEDGLVQASGFSFPSGHSSGAVVTCGMLAYVLLHLVPRRWHLPVLLAAVGLAFAIGASRAFLRVHHASDVLAGFASGSAWLAVAIASVELARWHRGRRAPP